MASASEIESRQDNNKTKRTNDESMSLHSMSTTPHNLSESEMAWRWRGCACGLAHGRIARFGD